MVKVQFLFALGMAENWLPVRKVRRMRVQGKGEGSESRQLSVCDSHRTNGNRTVCTLQKSCEYPPIQATTH